MIKFEKIIKNIPDYKIFYTVDELDESTRQLEKEYQELVEVFKIGESRKGHEINCIKIGNGKRTGLMFACPHPNEPIGAMMLEYFTKALCEDEEFRDSLDYTWYIVKCVDPDGVKLNEDWFKGPFTVTNYVRNFFRPAGDVQVEWSFPMNYKKYIFDRPLPETQALMALIERIKPDFTYSLHNAGFGGVFWYVGKELPQVWDALRDTTLESGLPLHLGQPEIPCCKILSAGIYKMTTGEDIYDYLEEFSPVPAEEAYKRGTDSSAYTKRFKDSLSLITELPYFYDERIKDRNLCGRSKRDVIIEGADHGEAHYRRLEKVVEMIRPYISKENQFILLVEEQIADLNSTGKAQREWAEQEEFAEQATVAEMFDSLLVSRFYAALSTSMTLRAIDFELDKTDSVDENGINTLKAARLIVEDYLEEECRFLEKNLNYQVVPIRDLVKIQLESGLIVSQTV
ncbi:MAG: hypothetical protein K2O96_01985 [Lachnospiraceae bacterium]|nr:hypothetical protein [Lachnospiraceae bacterium]